MRSLRFVAYVVYFDASQLPGYKEAKTLPVLTRFDPLELLTKPLPSAGTLRLTRLVQGG